MPIYKNGKLCVPKDKTKSRIYYVQAILGWLYFDMSEFKAAIEKQHEISQVPKPIQALVTKYCKQILYFADTYPTKSGKITKKGKDLSKQLRVDLMSFDAAYSVSFEKHRVDKRLHQMICELNGSVLWFLQQHDMTINSIRVHNPLSANPTSAEMADFLKKEKESLKGLHKGKKVLPHRPKDWEIRDIFKSRTELYQKANGVSKFIPHKTFVRMLNEHKDLHSEEPLTISEKGYYNLKEAWKNKSFDRFI